MKRMTLCVLSLLLSIITFAQSYFEGEVIYNNKYTSKVSGLTSEQLEMMMGTRQAYFVKNGSYKSETNGVSLQAQIYDVSTNRLYNKTAMSDTLYWFDAANNPDEVVEFTIEKNKEQILGVMCDALVLKTKQGSTVYYYSPKYKVNAQLYAKHQFGNWYYMLQKTGALPLKIITETAQFMLESTAVEVKPMSLGDQDFSVDAKAPLKKVM